MRRLPASIVIGVLLPSAIVIAQQVLFRAGINLVQVDVSVLDANRQPIHGLTSDDFAFTEDNRPQKIVVVSEVNVPDPEFEPGTWMSEVAPDVRTNTADDGRLLVLLLDDAELKSNLDAPHTIATIKSIAKEVIDRLGPTDMATVIFTYDKRGVQDFTHDRSRLRTAVETFTPKQFDLNAPVAHNVIGGGAMQSTWIHDSEDSFTYVAKYLASLPYRRKALVFITPTNWLKPNATDRVTDMFEYAQRAGVVVYSISPQNLHDLDAFGRVGADGDQNLGALNALEASPRRPTLTSETGGFRITSDSQVSAGVAQIFRETGSYYLIGYVPDNGAANGAFRNVSVAVTKPCAVVRGRTGYYAPRPASARKDPAAPPPLLSSLAGVLPNPDLPMQATAAAFARPGHGDAVVPVALGILEAPGTGTLETIDVQVRAFTERGDARGLVNQAAQILVRPIASSTGNARFEVLSEINLKPGQYELRLSAHSGSLDKSGSVYLDLDVPDFSKGPLSLSGIVVGVTSSVPVEPKEIVAGLLPIVPTTSRDFLKSDHATVFMRLYEPGKSVPIVLAVRIANRDQRLLVDRTETIGQDRFGAAHAADYRLDLPLDTLASGPYLLTLEATMGTTTMRRDVRFSVR